MLLPLKISELDEGSRYCVYEARTADRQDKNCCILVAR